VDLFFKLIGIYVVLHLSDKHDELTQWLCHYDSTINSVVTVANITTVLQAQ